MGYAVLDDQRRDALGMHDGQSEANGCAYIRKKQRIGRKIQLFREPFGHSRQPFERILEIASRWCRALAISRKVWGNDMIFVRKLWNQIAEHVRRRRKAVQEQNGGCVLGAGFAIEDFHPAHVNPGIEDGLRPNIRRVFPIHYSYFFFCSHVPVVLFSLDLKTVFDIEALLGAGLHLHARSEISTSSATNFDDRLSLGTTGPVEGGDRIVEGSHNADLCPQSAGPDMLDEFSQLSTVGFDAEVSRPTLTWPRIWRLGGGSQGSPGSNHGRRTLRDVAAEDIKNEIHFADVFQGVIVEIDELLCSEFEGGLKRRGGP